MSKEAQKEWSAAPESTTLTQPKPRNLIFWGTLTFIGIIAVLAFVKAWAGTVSPDDLSELQEKTIQIQTQEGIQHVPVSEALQDVVNYLIQVNQQ